MIFTRTISALSLTLLLTLSVAHRADGQSLDLLVGDITLVPGGTGFVDVIMDPNGVSTNVDLFEANFGIMDLGSNLGSLSFLFPPSDSAEPFVSDSSYVFSGLVGVEAIPISEAAFENRPVVSPQGGSGPNANAFDTTTDEPGSSAKGSVFINTPMLMARLQVQHSLDGNSPLDTIGEQFIVESEFPEVEDVDGFLVNDGLGISGTVTIEDAVVIPEPGMFSACAAISCLIAMRRRRRSRR